MTKPFENRPHRTAKLSWLVKQPTREPTAGLTAYREELGPSDLFSVFVRFESTSPDLKIWDKATIYALVEAMEYRLPSVGHKLIFTAGAHPVAIAEII